MGFEFYELLVVVILTAACLYLALDKRSVKHARKCACGHWDHFHAKRTGMCYISHGVSTSFPNGSSCACQQFTEPPPPEVDPMTKELERIAKL